MLNKSVILFASINCFKAISFPPTLVNSDFSLGIIASIISVGVFPMRSSCDSIPNDTLLLISVAASAKLSNVVLTSSNGDNVSCRAFICPTLTPNSFDRLNSSCVSLAPRIYPKPAPATTPVPIPRLHFANDALNEPTEDVKFFKPSRLSLRDLLSCFL